MVIAESAIARPVVSTGLKTITGLVEKARMFDNTLAMLKSTVQSLTPKLEKLKREEEKQYGAPTKETEGDLERLQEAKKLVDKCSNLPLWKRCWLPFYQEKLQKMDDRLQRSLKNRADKNSLEEEQRRLRSQTNHPFKAPLKPELTVGFDAHLMELRAQLMESGSSVPVLTGLPGSGKTTLATLLCWDKQVRAKFGKNVLFIPVSRTPKLNSIVETLCEQYGRKFVDLGHEHTVRQLKDLLREIGESPLMLVLDDVWSESESLIEDFHVQLPHYKIMVTSRFNLKFGTPHPVQPLSFEHAVTLFNQLTKDSETDDFVGKVARGCGGLPLALEVIGKSLIVSGQPNLVRQKIERLLSHGQSILNSDTSLSLINKIKKYLDDLLEDEPMIMECFMDLGLFPENHMTPVSALIDMWIELYEHVQNDVDAMLRVTDLTNRHLAKIVHRSNREVVVDVDMSYSNHFLMQHGLLRDVAIHQSNQESEQRKRLMIDLSGNNRPEGWEGQNQQGFVSRMLSFIPVWSTKQKQKQVVARTLSISTDETFTSDWSNMQPDETEVLILNIRSSKFTLPEFAKIMSKLRVLIVTNYGFHPSELNKFELLDSLPDLKRIRLEKVSVPHLCKLVSLKKLSLYMCNNTMQAFGSSSIRISDALPNLEEMNIDYCNDLRELPSELCNISTMKKLSITSCHKLSTLPQEIGNLENLELLRLSSCSELHEIPESVGRLQKLSFLDISNCVGLMQLPSNIDELLSLRKLHMWGCSSLSGLGQLPLLIDKFQHLQDPLYVTCDPEVAALWKGLPGIPNLRIETFEADDSLAWLGVFS